MSAANLFMGSRSLDLPGPRPAAHDHHSDRHGDDEDDRRPDSLCGRHEGPARGHSQGRGCGPDRDRRSDESACTCRGYWLRFRSRARLHGHREDGVDVRHEGSQYGHHGEQRCAHTRANGHEHARGVSGTDDLNHSSFSPNCEAGSGLVFFNMVKCIFQKVDDVLVRQTVVNVFAGSFSPQKACVMQDL